MLNTILSSALLALATSPFAAAPQGEPKVDVKIPGTHIPGESFEVGMTFTAGPEGASLAPWKLTTAAFDMNGKPLGARPEGTIELEPGTSIEVKMDMGPLLSTVTQGFTLSMVGAEVSREVKVLAAAPEGLNFMEMPEGELGNYTVLLQTNQGDMVVEFMPDVAPGHVRNFLDLSYTGFYDGSAFHRVSPTFMIQGGCPNTKEGETGRPGTGRGPRMLEAEFNDTKHVRGILSMARGPSENSASCQFFIMADKYPSLDNQYSVFGRLVSGDETLTKISNAQGTRGGDGTIAPSSPQRIQKAVVLKSGS